MKSILQVIKAKCSESFLKSIVEPRENTFEPFDYRFLLLANTSNNLTTYVNWQYDIAIIVLKDEIVPGDKIKIARLPKQNVPCPKGERLVVSGWGRDMARFGIRSQDKLWALSQDCLDDSSCPALDDMVPKSNMICIGDQENLLNSACNGDSGGMFYPVSYTHLTLPTILLV